jgi:3-oxoacyl-[acyl-carrier-protein] synthase II
MGTSSVANSSGIAMRETALANAMAATLRDAGAGPEDVGHVHAHGLATRSCDEDEANAIQQVFGTRAEPVPVAAAKSYFGNLGAAGGLVELVASVLALADGNLFATLNYDTPDPKCPLNVCRGGTAAGDSFLNTSVTPQGQASAVMVRKLR